MQAVMQTGQGLTIQEITKPVPGKHDILVRVHATSVTRGDLVLKNMPRISFLPLSLFGVRYKPTPGHEFAGVVEAVGAGVTRFAVGDAVFGTTTGLRAGANAEFVCLPESSKTSVIAKKPDTLTDAQAAALPVGAMTAMYLLNRAGIQPDESVLVYGASGSVGSYAIQIAKHLGATVTGVCSTRNVEMVRSIGADQVIDYRNEDFADNSSTYDVILDAVGKTTRDQRKRALKSDGRIVTIRSVTKESTDALTHLAELAAHGTIRPVIDRCYTLDAITDAYDYVASGRKVGNVVVQVGNSGENHNASA